ncbi:hypothetical protein GCM10010507_63410 [Streptomyces cinnamoneus]|uniref:Uncharacterized protein n=1 Tax=Streptomyces cinnamoneus TaxID=53446 RepID=A0A918WRT4_STRCJ|nr:hypothetical protein GCM10010507_63410 [Streptomyces cinnamoneus]
MLQVEAAEEGLPAAVDISLGAAVPDHHSQTGLFTPPLGSLSTVKRMTVPSMMGSGPS